MNNRERKTDFERSAHAWWRWALEGGKLFKASEYLQKEYSSAMKMIREEKGNLPSGAELLAPMIFMRAISLENLIKALYIKRGNSVTDGNGSLSFKHHALSWFYKELKINLGPIEDQTLKKLSEAIYSWGRYPVPKSYKYWRMDSPGVTGIPPIFIWSDEDEKTCRKLLRKIRSSLGITDKDSWHKIINGIHFNDHNQLLGRV